MTYQERFDLIKKLAGKVDTEIIARRVGLKRKSLYNYPVDFTNKDRKKKIEDIKDFIRENYKTMTNVEMAEMLGETVLRINWFTYYLGLAKKKEVEVKKPGKYFEWTHCAITGFSLRQAI